MRQPRKVSASLTHSSQCIAASNGVTSLTTHAPTASSVTNAAPLTPPSTSPTTRAAFAPSAVDAPCPNVLAKTSGLARWKVSACESASPESHAPATMPSTSTISVRMSSVNT